MQPFFISISMKINSDSLRAAVLSGCDTIQVLMAAQVQFLSYDNRGRGEAVIQYILRQYLESRTMLDD